MKLKRIIALPNRGSKVAITRSGSFFVVVDARANLVHAWDGAPLMFRDQRMIRNCVMRLNAKPPKHLRTDTLCVRPYFPLAWELQLLGGS